MPLTTSPCKGCEDRYVGCHGKCDAYIAFKSIREKERTTVSKKKSVDEYQFIATQRMKKKKRQKVREW